MVSTLRRRRWHESSSRLVLPLFILAAALLLRRSEHGPALARGCLVFLVLMALSILPMFGIEASHGQAIEAPVAALFAVIAVIAGLLAVAKPAVLSARAQGEPRSHPTEGHERRGARQLAHPVGWRIRRWGCSPRRSPAEHGEGTRRPAGALGPNH